MVKVGAKDRTNLKKKVHSIDKDKFKIKQRSERKTHKTLKHTKSDEAEKTRIERIIFGGK